MRYMCREFYFVGVEIKLLCAMCGTGIGCEMCGGEMFGEFSV
jgi:hypothetical protein